MYDVKVGDMVTCDNQGSFIFEVMSIFQEDYSWYCEIKLETNGGSISQATKVSNCRLILSEVRDRKLNELLK